MTGRVLLWVLAVQTGRDNLTGILTPRSPGSDWEEAMISMDLELEPSSVGIGGQLKAAAAEEES